jgi:hypothetical protein
MVTLAQLEESLSAPLRHKLKAGGVLFLLRDEPPPPGLVARYLRTERVIVVWAARLAELSLPVLREALLREIGQALNPSGNGNARWAQ